MSYMSICRTLEESQTQELVEQLIQSYNYVSSCNLNCAFEGTTINYEINKKQISEINIEYINLLAELEDKKQLDHDAALEDLKRQIEAMNNQKNLETQIEDQLNEQNEYLVSDFQDKNEDVNALTQCQKLNEFIGNNQEQTDFNIKKLKQIQTALNPISISTDLVQCNGELHNCVETKIQQIKQLQNQFDELDFMNVKQFLLQKEIQELKQQQFQVLQDVVGWYVNERGGGE